MTSRRGLGGLGVFHKAMITMEEVAGAIRDVGIGVGAALLGGALYRYVDTLLSLME